MRRLLLAFLRSPWRALFVAVIVAVSTASATAFSVIPNLATQYPDLARGLWLLIVLLAILPIVAGRISAALEMRARLFRFRERVTIVTGTLQDRQGNYGYSPYDHQAAQLVGMALRDTGIKSHIMHCRSSDLPRNAGANLVLVGGPITNDLSAEVNHRLSDEVSWYRGFSFVMNGSGNTGTDLPPERNWTLRDRGIPGLEIPFLGFHTEGNNADSAMLYIGPNPVNPENWLVLVAGLGPLGTYGAAKAFKDSQFLEQLSCGATSDRRYISALVQYQYDVHEPSNGRISGMVTTCGTVH